MRTRLTHLWFLFTSSRAVGPCPHCASQVTSPTPLTLPLIAQIIQARTLCRWRDCFFAFDGVRAHESIPQSGSNTLLQRFNSEPFSPFADSCARLVFLLPFQLEATPEMTKKRNKDHSQHELMNGSLIGHRTMELRKLSPNDTERRWPQASLLLTQRRRITPSFGILYASR